VESLQIKGRRDIPHGACGKLGSWFLGHSGLV
jgi:hypothetical protein